MRRALALTLVFATTLASDLRAQSTNASLTGRITDPSKAVIVEARIAAVNTATDSRYETTSNGSGEYYLPDLPHQQLSHRSRKVGVQKVNQAGCDSSRPGRA